MSAVCSMRVAPVRASKAVTMRKSVAGKPVVAAVSMSRKAVARFVVRASELSSDAVADAISDAKDTCADGTPGECAAAWDTVEELSAEASHKKATKKVDPMEDYCAEDPSADECRVYED